MVLASRCHLHPASTTAMQVIARSKWAYMSYVGTSSATTDLSEAISRFGSVSLKPKSRCSTRNTYPGDSHVRMWDQVQVAKVDFNQTSTYVSPLLSLLGPSLLRRIRGTPRSFLKHYRLGLNRLKIYPLVGFTSDDISRYGYTRRVSLRVQFLI